MMHKYINNYKFWTVLLLLYCYISNAFCLNQVLNYSDVTDWCTHLCLRKHWYKHACWVYIYMILSVCLYMYICAHMYTMHVRKYIAHMYTMHVHKYSKILILLRDNTYEVHCISSVYCQCYILIFLYSVISLHSCVLQTCSHNGQHFDYVWSKVILFATTKQILWIMMHKQIK